MVKKLELISYLNNFLQIDEFVDSSKNGVQVDTQKTEIKKIGYAVDATTYTFKKAVELNLDFLFVHHGIFWGDEQVLTGIHYDRIKILIENNIGLYACHLPLDAHNLVGNNIEILKLRTEFFEIKNYEKEDMFFYQKKPIAFGIRYEKATPIIEIEKFCKKIGIRYNLENFGNHKEIKSVVFGSGGGGSHIPEAKEKNFDLFLTGEGAHRNSTLAREIQQSVLRGGHYETETFGIKALCEHIKNKFEIEISDSNC